MWQIKKFQTKEDMNTWIEKMYSQIQYQEIFVNNGYAVEWRSLRVI